MDQTLPRSAPVARTYAGDTQIRILWSTSLAAAGIAVATVSQAAVHRLRAHGAKVRPLQHHVDLPGRSLPRSLVVSSDSAVAGHGLPDPDASPARRLDRGLVAGDCGVAIVRVDRAGVSPELFGPDGFPPGSLGHQRLSVRVLDRLVADRSR